jgi:hypothetical protein
MDIRAQILQSANAGKSMVSNVVNKLVIPLTVTLLSNVIFAVLYLFLCNDPEDWDGMDNANDSVGKKLFNRLYFTMTTNTTVGYGDITPKSVKAKILVMMHFLVVFTNIIVIFA